MSGFAAKAMLSSNNNSRGEPRRESLYYTGSGPAIQDRLGRRHADHRHSSFRTAAGDDRPTPAGRSSQRYPEPGGMRGTGAQPVPGSPSASPPVSSATIFRFRNGPGENWNGTRNIYARNTSGSATTASASRSRRATTGSSRRLISHVQVTLNCSASSKINELQWVMFACQWRQRASLKRHLTANIRGCGVS